MKSALVKFDEEQQKRLNKYQAKQELETGVRPNYSEVFFRGLDCLIGSVPSTSEQSRKDGERIKRLQEELEKADGNVKLLTEHKKELLAEIARLKAERGAESNQSLPASENIALRKKIAELEAKVNQTKAEKLKEELGIKGKLVSGSQIADLAASRETATNFLKT